MIRPEWGWKLRNYLLTFTTLVLVPLLPSLKVSAQEVQESAVEDLAIPELDSEGRSSEVRKNQEFRIQELRNPGVQKNLESRSLGIEKLSSQPTAHFATKVQEFRSSGGWEDASSLLDLQSPEMAPDSISLHQLEQASVEIAKTAHPLATKALSENTLQPLSQLTNTLPSQRRSSVDLQNSEAASTETSFARFADASQPDKPVPENSEPAKNGDPGKLQTPFLLDVEFRGSEQRRGGTLNFRLPLWQSDKSFLFSDLSFTPSDQRMLAGNVGLAYRRVLHSSADRANAWVWGAYAFYDYTRSGNDHSYSQASLGTELLHNRFEFRVNGYLPEGGENVVGRRILREVTPVGTNLNLTTFNLVAFERALPGFDLEVGYRHPLSKTMSLGFYGGYFHYDASDFPTIAGPSGRIQYEWENAFGLLGSRLQVGAAISHDSVRDTNTAGYLRFSIPIGNRPTAAKPLRGVDWLMARSIVRNPEILTLAQDINKAPGSELGPEIASIQQGVILNPISGQPLNLFFVDADGSALSLGTQADPFTLAQAQTNAQPGDVIFLLNDNGTISTSNNPGSTLALQDGQQVLGVGDNTSTPVNLPSGAVLIVNSGTGRPTLTAPATANVITLASNNRIQGITIAGGANGIFGRNNANVTINDVVIRDTANAGISLNWRDATVTNTLISNPGGPGILLQNISGNFTFNNVTITNTGGSAFQINNGNAQVNFTGNITNTGSRAIELANLTGGAASFGGTITNTNGQGILLSNTTATVSIANATIANPSGTGIDIQNSNGTFTFSNTTITNATGVALNVSGGAPNVTYRGNITSTGGTAVQIANTTGSTITLTDGAIAQAGNGSTVNILNNAGSTITVNSTVTATNGSGITIANNTGTNTIAFNGNITLGTTRNRLATTPLTLSNNSATTNITFANLNIATTGDEGLNLSGNTTGNLTITDGTVDTTGESAVSLANTTANITLSNVTATDTGTNNGLEFTNYSGSFIVTGNTTATNTPIGVSVIGGNATYNFGTTAINTASNTGLNIAGTSTGNITFGAVAITGNNITPTGIRISDTGNPTLTLGNVTISNVTGTALDMTGADATVNTGVMTISGAAIGIDLRSTTGNRTITMAPGSSISNVTIGVRLGSGNTTDATQTANASFTFGDGSNANGVSSTISATGFTLDTRGLNSASGFYNFNDVNFTGTASFQTANYFFVSASGTGDGTLINPANITTADAFAGATTFVLIADPAGPGGVITASNTFTLADNQSIDGFGNGNTLSASGSPPPNVVGNFGSATIADPTGNGAATLTTTTGNVVSLSNNTVISNIIVAGSDGYAFSGTTVSNVTITGNQILGGTSGTFNFTNPSGNIAIQNNNNITSTSGSLLNVEGGNAAIVLNQGTGSSLTNTGGTGITIANTTGGSVAVTGAAINNSTATAVNLTNNTGTVTFANTTIANSTGTAFNVTGGNGTITYNGTISQANNAGVVDIQNRTGGNISLNGNITATNGSGVSIANSTDTNNIAFTGTTTLGSTTTRLTATPLILSNNTATTSITFANLNIATQNDEGLNLDGTSAPIGNLTIANGTVNTIGESAISLTNTTANITLASVTANANATANSGLEFTNYSGSFVTGSTSVSNTTGTGISINGGNATYNFGTTTVSNANTTSISIGGAVPANITFGNTTIAGGNTTATGIRISATSNPNLTFGTVAISNVTGTAFDMTGANATVNTGVMTISGAAIGIDLRSTTGNRNVVMATGSSISNVGIGVRLGSGNAADTSQTANANFTFGDGSDVVPNGRNSSISATGFTLDTRGLVSTSLTSSGTYNFLDVNFNGTASFTGANYFFVSANGTGNGTLTNPANITTADAFTGVTTFVLIDDTSGAGGVITASTSFTLSDSQSINGFGNGNTLTAGAVPVNVLGDFGTAIADPGFGAATLTTTSGNVITLANSTAISNIVVDGSDAYAIAGTNFSNATITGNQILGGTAGVFNFNTPGGTIDIGNNTITSSSGTLLTIEGGNAVITLNQGTGSSLSNTNGTGIQIANTTGGSVAVTGATISNSTGSAVNLTNNTGTVTIANATITNSNGTAFNVTGGNGTITYNGTISQANNTGTVAIQNRTGGTVSFNGDITATNGTGILVQNNADVTVNFGNTSLSTGTNTAITLANNTGTSAVNFTGTTNVTTTSGNGVNITVAGGSYSFANLTIATGTGTGLLANGTGNLTVTTGSINSTGATALDLSDRTLNATFANVASGGGTNNINLTNVTGTLVMNGGSLSNATGTSFNVTGGNGTITYNGTIAQASNAGVVGIQNRSGGNISLNGNITATNGSGITIANSTGTNSIAFNGTTTLGNTTTRLTVTPLTLANNSNTTSISFANLNIATTGDEGLNLNGNTTGNLTIANGTVDTIGENAISLANTTANITLASVTVNANATANNGLEFTNYSGSFRVTGNTSVSNTTGAGISITGGNATYNFGTTTVSNASTAGISIGGAVPANITFGNTTIAGGNTTATGIRISATSNPNLTFGTVAISNVTGTAFDMTGANATVNTGVMTISGAAIGIDLRSTTGNRTITMATGSSISNVGIGVRLGSGNAADTSQTANANFTFGDGSDVVPNGRNSSISATTFTVDTRGLDPASGFYDFDDVNFTGRASFQGGNFFFVSASGTGDGSLANPANITTADAFTSATTFVLIDDTAGAGGVITASSTFTLAVGQSITGFGNGNTLSGGAPPPNVSGTFPGSIITDPTGNGAATLTTGSGDVVQLVSDTSVSNIIVAGSSGFAFTGTNVSNVSITGNGITGGTAGVFNFTNPGGNITIQNNNNITSTSGSLLNVAGGNAEIVLNQGTGTSLTNTGGTGITIANTTGGSVAVTGANLSNSTGSAVTLTNNAGTVTFANTTITNSNSTAFNVSGGNATITYNGTITQANNTGTVAIQNRTGGTIAFNGNITATNGSGIAIANNTGTNSISFNGNTTLGTTSNRLTTTPLALSNNSAATTITFTNLNIATNVATGLNLNGNTYGNLTISNGSVDSTGATAVNLTNTTASITLASVSANSTTNPGINASNFTGTLNVTGLTNITTTSGTGVSITSAGGTYSFGNLTIASGTGTGLLANGTGNLTVTTGSINSTGGTALNLSDRALNATFTGVTSGGGVNNINLTNVTGTLAMNGGALSGATGTSFNVTGGNATITYAGTITSGAGVRSVSVQNRTGGAATLSGNITSNGTGILVQNNTGGTVNFSGASQVLNTGVNAAVTLANNSGSTINFTGGGLQTTTTSGTGFVATGGGTVNVTGANNTVTSTTSTGVNITNTTIGSNGVTFRSVSTNGATNGIVLNNSGTGNFTVTGNGTVGSGGTIQNGATGISLTNAQNISLAWMQLNDFTDFAIRGTSVVNFTMDNTVISGTNGNDPGADEGSVRFTELTGSARIANSTISGAVENNFTVINTSGTLDRITFSNVTFGAMSAATGDDALLIETLNNAIVNVTVQNSFFTAARGDHFQRLLNGSGASDLVFTGNTISNTGVTAVGGGGGIRLNGGNNSGINASATFNISNNTIRDSRGTALAVNKQGGTGSFSGTIANNTIGLANVTNSGSAEGSGIFLLTDGAGSYTANVTGNQVFQYGNFGIFMQTGGSGTVGNGTMTVTVTNNTVSNPGNLTFAKNGVQLNAGTTVGDTYRVCLNFSGNTLAGTGTDGGTDFRLRQRQSTTVYLPGYTGANNDNSAVVTFVQGNNGGAPTGSATNTVPTGGGFQGNCPF